MRRWMLLVLVSASCVACTAADDDGLGTADGAGGALDGGAGEVDGGMGGATCSLDSDGPWSCDDLTGTTTNPDRSYDTTSFGCWVDEDGVDHADPGDNCVPACDLDSIDCAGMTGPDCERALNWYSADSDRFGCGTRVRVTNPDDGTSAILAVIDRGLSCGIENNVDEWVLDMSYRASYYLFGGPTSATEHADVLVEVVDPSTPLGPTDGPPVCGAE